jgi:Tfp pilus assembly protein FimT
MEMVIVCGIVGVLSVMAAPMFSNAIAGFRLSGDARGVSNATAVAKMRAAADFSRVRVYADLTARTYCMQVFEKPSVTYPLGRWVTQGGDTSLSTGVSFGYGAVTASPPVTQGTILQAPLCVDDAGANIANTACIMFNSRGVPVDNTFAPTPADALYVMDSSMVYGVTISATGLLRMWRTPRAATPSWVRN